MNMFIVVERGARMEHLRAHLGMTRWIAVFAAALLAASNLQAQSWPSKPVRIIVNGAPGGVADVTARVLGARLTETLGQACVAQNRAAGHGHIGDVPGSRAWPHAPQLMSSPALAATLPSH